MKKIIDTHAHIISRFLGNNLDALAKQIDENNIIVVNMTIGPDVVKDALDIYKKYPWILPTAGSHALFISEYKDEDINKIEALINDDIVAIGEIGLDYTNETTDEIKKLQFEIFEKQIVIAQKRKLPVIVHTRNSADDVIKIIKKYPDVKFVMHCWEGNVNQTKELLKISNKIWFGYGGKITLNDESISKIRKKSIKKVPLNRLLLETDSPAPSTFPQSMIDENKEINYPWFIRESAKWIANYLNINEDDLIDQCNQNAIEFYNLDKNILDK